MKKYMIGLACALVLSLTFPAQAKTSKVNLETLPSYTKTSKLITLEAPVEAIDAAKRTITVKSIEGIKISTKVDDAVKNLDQIKPGDVVILQYYESTVWNLNKVPTGKVKETTTETVEEPAGNEPGMVKVAQTKLVATIEKIDEKAPAVTLKRPDGTSFTVKVKDPTALKLVKVGDQVAIRYTEAVAVSVEKKTK